MSPDTLGTGPNPARATVCLARSHAAGLLLSVPCSLGSPCERTDGSTSRRKASSPPQRTMRMRTPARVAACRPRWITVLPSGLGGRRISSSARIPRKGRRWWLERTLCSSPTSRHASRQAAAASFYAAWSGSPCFPRALGRGDCIKGVRSNALLDVLIERASP